MSDPIEVIIEDGVQQVVAVDVDSPVPAITVEVTNAGGGGSGSVTLTGDVTGSGAGSITTTLANVAAPGTYGQVAVNSKGLVTSGGATDVQHGGTGATSLAAHGVLIGNGTGAVLVVNPGTAGQVLTSNGASADPTYQTPIAPPPSSGTNIYNYQNFS